MQYRQVSLLLMLAAGGAFAKLHDVAACISNRHYSEIGGTPFSVSYTWAKTYEILTDATKCACDLYRNRNTGNSQWDKCPDCTFDGTYCNSKAWHIGGDEMTYYCEKKCGAEGAEGS